MGSGSSVDISLGRVEERLQGESEGVGVWGEGVGGLEEKGGGRRLTSLLGGRLLAKRVDGEGRIMDISG